FRFPVSNSQFAIHLQQIHALLICIHLQQLPFWERFQLVRRIRENWYFFFL
ncbi:unnamed protein product, partial [Arabidopsis halleri]